VEIDFFLLLVIFFLQFYFIFICFCVVLKKKKNSVWVFLSLLKDLLNSVFVRAIEHKLLTLECTHAFCCTVCALALDSFQLRASAHHTDARAQCTFKLDRTSVAIECTNRILNSCMLTLDCTVLVLELIFAVNSSKPEAAKYKVFDFFGLLLFFFICLFFSACLLSFICCY
jgi:hypothetical protein